jgi:hypothetical protein
MYNAAEYYRDEAVRTRMVEFLGGATMEEVSSVYIRASNEGEDDFGSDFQSPKALWTYLEEGLDVARSLWDRDALVVDLDVEYVNFDDPAAAYVDPERAFAIQQPVEHVIEEVLVSFGISPLHLMSGRGHHFLWQVPRTSPVFARLMDMGPVPDFLRGFYANPIPALEESLSEAHMAAFAGLGLVMEYVAHRVKEQASRACVVPVELTALEVGAGGVGREMVSIDISEYGDPLSTRCLRIPFSVYLKPWRLNGHNGTDFEHMLPFFLIPRYNMDLFQSLLAMRNPEEARRIARRASTAIPNQEQGMGRLIDAYIQSPLAAFHRFFYQEEHEPSEAWPDTYDRAPLHVLPHCVRHILEQPNELLLKPGGLAQVVRSLLALGWHPRHIAGLIRSKYERDFGWGGRWYRDNAGSRADFYTRIFTGLVVTGLDELVDFNCRSTQEKAFCFVPDPTCDLEAYRNSLLERVRHERLASGPVNGLFLPNQHL